MTNTPTRHLQWESRMRAVLDEVREERYRQVVRYGTNDDLPDGTGPTVPWLRFTTQTLGDPLNAMTADEIERAFREDYEYRESVGRGPTWLDLVREEVAESFKESDPKRLREELIQVAALCVSWVESLDVRAES